MHAEHGERRNRGGSGPSRPASGLRADGWPWHLVLHARVHQPSKQAIPLRDDRIVVEGLECLRAHHNAPLGRLEAVFLEDGNLDRQAGVLARPPLFEPVAPSRLPGRAQLQLELLGVILLDENVLHLDRLLPREVHNGMRTIRNVRAMILLHVNRLAHPLGLLLHAQRLDSCLALLLQPHLGVLLGCVLHHGLSQWLVLAVENGLLGVVDSIRGEGLDLLGELLDDLGELRGVVDNPLSKPEVQRRVHGAGLAGREEPLRVPETNGADDVRGDHSRDKTQFDLRQRDVSRLDCDDHVADARQAYTTAHGRAVEAADGELREALPRRQVLGEHVDGAPLGCVKELRYLGPGGVLDLLLVLALALGGARLEGLRVTTGTEHAPVAREHRNAHVRAVPQDPRRVM
mmetsp:Transcript_15293/g.34713  ORF Transcript_15293/g.34713 Transcript_15293/m.34713 type:complete len:402 (-) Transcript_15293:447-1652(-)